MDGNTVVVVRSPQGEQIFVNGTLIPGARLIVGNGTKAVISLPVTELKIETKDAAEQRGARRIQLWR